MVAPAQGRMASPAERALFDLGVSVAAARMLKAVHVGRVDPATMYWGYDITPKHVDLAALLREVRGGKGLAAALDALAPPVTHYARARRTLADYKARRRPASRPRVPALPKGRKKVEPGQTWDGVAQLAARLRALATCRPTPPSTALPTRRPLVDAVKRFQDRHGLDPDGVIGAGTIDGLNVSLAAPRAADRAGDGAHALAAEAERPAERLRQRAAVPDVGDRPHHRRRAAADERRGRQVAQPPDADLRRADGIRDLPALLESAARASP